MAAGDAGAPEPAGGEQADARIAIGQQRHEHGQGPLARAGGQALERAQPLRVRQLGGVARGDADRIGPAEIRVRVGEPTASERGTARIAIVGIDGSISIVYASLAPHMTREIIVSILEGEGAEGKGGSFKIGEEREATCFISTPGELMAIARVRARRAQGPVRVAVDGEGRTLRLRVRRTCWASSWPRPRSTKSAPPGSARRLLARTPDAPLAREELAADA